MNWTGALREVRTMRFEEVYGRFQRGRLSCAEAADILGMSERNFLRYRTRYEADGAEGLYDRRVGRVSGRRVPVDEATRLIELYATKYFDFNVKLDFDSWRWGRLSNPLICRGFPVRWILL